MLHLLKKTSKLKNLKPDIANKVMARVKTPDTTPATHLFFMSFRALSIGELFSVSVSFGFREVVSFNKLPQLTHLTAWVQRLVGLEQVVVITHFEYLDAALTWKSNITAAEIRRACLRAGASVGF